MPSRVKWNARAVEAQVKRGLRRNMAEACMRLRRDVVRSLGIPGPRKGNLLARPSAPGEPPHKRTGNLRRSITHEVALDGLSGKVGSFGAKGVVYAAPLELGTRHMAARPYLRPALDRMKGELAKILSRPIQGGVHTSTLGLGELGEAAGAGT